MNKLRRTVELKYFPGIPAVPPSPPVCTTTSKKVKNSGALGSNPGRPPGWLVERVENSGGTSSLVFLMPLTLSNGDVVYVPARNPYPSSPPPSPYTTVYETTCVDGDPGKPGTPGTYKSISGGPDWRASARSIERVTGDLVASFDIGPEPRVAVGLATTDSGPAFADIRMGVLFRRDGSANVVIPLLDGEEQGPVGYYGAGDRVSLIRAGGKFIIAVGGVPLFDAPAPTNQSVVLDAMVYTSNDYVENPSFGEVVSVRPGELRGGVGLFVKLSSATSVSGSLGLRGAVGSLVDGLASVQVSGEVGFVGRVSGVTSDRVSVFGEVGFFSRFLRGGEYSGAHLSMPPMELLASDSLYSRITLELPPLSLQAAGGSPTQEVSGADISLPTFGFYALSRTGGLLTLERKLPRITGVASDRPYGQIVGSLPALTMSADDGFTVPGFAIHIENVEFRDGVMTDPTLLASIEFGLELQPTLSFAVVADENYIDGLLLDPSLSAADYLQAMISSGLNLSSATKAPAEGFGQYGFDLDSAAATRYEGFDFRGFAFSGADTYAFRKDGLYRLRGGDDDGNLRSALVDFGVTGLGTLGKKHIETVYLGLSTDGRAFLKLAGDDGREKTYRVIQRDPTYRALTGRGVTAREWGAKLEIVDADSVELDGVEFVVAASGRKWVR